MKINYKDILEQYGEELTNKFIKGINNLPMKEINKITPSERNYKEVMRALNIPFISSNKGVN